MPSGRIAVAKDRAERRTKAEALFQVELAKYRAAVAAAKLKQDQQKQAELAAMRARLDSMAQENWQRYGIPVQRPHVSQWESMGFNF